MADPKSTSGSGLYDRDFVAWSRQQAEALRAVAKSGSNLQLDWQNLAEEVETLGASERRALHSQIQRVIRHLLKLEYFSAGAPRRGWVETVDDARSEIELVLDMSPSLRNEVAAAIGSEQARGIRAAIRDLQRYGEIDAPGIVRVRAARYTEEQVLGDWYPPDPPKCNGGGEPTTDA